jgi:hypothetical protein
MSTTGQILDALAAARRRHQADADLVQLQHVDAQIIAHQALQRLRTEHAALTDRGDGDGGDTAAAAARRDALTQLAAQIDYWRRQVDVDADQPAPQDEPAAETGTPAPAAAARRRRSV